MPRIPRSMNTTSEKKLPFYSLEWLNRALWLVLSFAHKIITISGKKQPWKTRVCKAVKVALYPKFNFMPFVDFFLFVFFFEHLGWPSVRAYNQLLTGCGQNFCNLWRGFSSQMRLGYCRGCQATFGCLFWDLPTCCIRGQNFMCSPLPRARRAETSIFILSLSDPFNIFRECTVETESPFPPGSVQIASFCSTRLHFAYCSQDRVSLPTSKACSSCFAHLEWLSRLSLYLVFF